MARSYCVRLRQEEAESRLQQGAKTVLEILAVRKIAGLIWAIYNSASRCAVDAATVVAADNARLPGA